MEIQENNPITVGTPPPPLFNEETRQPYKYRMFYDGNRFIANADDPNELLDVLIEGYLNMTPDERQEARILYAYGVQGNFQDRLYLTPEVKEGLKDWEFLVATGQWGSSRHDPSGFWVNFVDEDAPEGDKVDYWHPEIPVPLVIIDAFYKPYTDKEPPFSFHQDTHPVHVIRLGASEEEFLLSLNPLGETFLVPHWMVSSGW